MPYGDNEDRRAQSSSRGQQAFRPRKMGFSSQNPWEILVGKGKPGMKETFDTGGIKGILNIVQQGMHQVVGSGIEMGAEARSYLGAAVGQLSDDGASNNDMAQSYRPMFDTLAGEDGLSLSRVWDGTDGTAPASGAAAPPTPEENSQVMANLNRKLDAPAAAYSLIEAAKGYDLAPEFQAQIDALEVESSRQVDEINNEIAALQIQMTQGQAQYAGLVSEAERVGILPPLDSEQGKVLATTLDSLESTIAAEDQRGGLTDDVLAAITSVGDAQFASSDPDQAFNLVTHKIDFEQGLISEIENLVYQRGAVQDNAESTAEAIRKEGTSDQMSMPLDTPTSEGLFTNVYGDFVSEALEKSGTELDTFQEEAFALQATELGQAAAIAGGFDTLQPQIDVLATTYGIDPGTLTTALSNGLEQGLEAAGLADAWRETDVLNPGSPTLGAGIRDTMISMGASEEEVNRMVNSESMHKLIELASSGEVGAENGADMHGLGGLNEDTYETFGTDYETIKGDAEAQLAALIQYIYTKFGGDPVHALESFKQGSWGGLD